MAPTCLACSYTVAVGPSPLLITLLAVVFEFYQTHYFFETAILPDPTQREILPHIILPWIVRLLLCGIVLFEGVRTILFHFIIASLYIESIANGMGSLINSDNFRCCIKRYNQLQIILTTLLRSTSIVAGAFLILGQVGIVSLLWVTINGYGHTPSMLVYGMFPILAIFVVFNAIFVFKKAVDISEISNELTRNRWAIGCVARTKNARGMTFIMKIHRSLKRTGKGLRPVAMAVEYLVVLDKQFEVWYFSLLIDNLTNAVILYRI